LNDLLDFLKEKNQALEKAKKNPKKDSLRRLMDKKLKGVGRLQELRSYL